MTIKNCIRTRRKQFLKNLIRFVKSSRICASLPRFLLISLYMFSSDHRLLESDPDLQEISGHLFAMVCAVVTIFTYVNKNAHLGYKLNS
jgi:hypothetical protein